MARTLDTKCYLDTVCELLQQGQCNVPVPVTGSSMVPFLHDGDTVYLNAAPEKLKKGDVVLYTRSNGDYVLHRIRKVHKDGSFVLVGDAQQLLEHLPSRAQIHGIAVAAQHKGKRITKRSFYWWLYRHVWLWVLPWRYRLMAMRKKK